MTTPAIGLSPKDCWDYVGGCDPSTGEAVLNDVDDPTRREDGDSA